MLNGWLINLNGISFSKEDNIPLTVYVKNINAHTYTLFIGDDRQFVKKNMKIFVM